MTTIPLNFSRLTPAQRLQYLQQQAELTEIEMALLRDSVSENWLNLLNQYAENVIGGFALPLGIVPQFPLNDQTIWVPMVIEETSVIAAVSKTAKWIGQSGRLTTRMLGHEIIGQIQVARLKNIASFIDKVEQYQTQWINAANQQVVPSLLARGGGVTQLRVRTFKRPDQDTMAVIHVLMNTGDAMGANMVNQVCEFLRKPIEQATDETVTMCILSNLTEHKLVEAQVILEQVNPALAERIVEAGLFAECDPYRAATHNKGVMNGMDAVLIATGNDWRAVEAGVHAYAACSGQYRPVTSWQYCQQQLIGTLTAPILVGTVGGVTRTHPLAKLALKLSKITCATQLSELVAAVGLAQNLAALRALTSEGIVQGHMKLHLHNLLIAVGATAGEQAPLKQKAQAYLRQKGKITQSDMIYLLQTLRRAC